MYQELSEMFRLMLRSRDMVTDKMGYFNSEKVLCYVYLSENVGRTKLFVHLNA